MVRRSVVAVFALGTVAAMLLLIPGGETLSQTVREVFVTNFPRLQKVDGTVSVKGPVKLAKMVKFEDLTVPPVRREDTTRLVDAGVLEVEGFPALVLSLHGVVKGHVTGVGSVGALLIPDETTIQEAFVEQGVLHFHLEAVAGGISAQTPYFASNQPRYTLGFPRYRVLLYNTTDKSVSANVFAYLTN